MKYLFISIFSLIAIQASAQKFWGDIDLGATNYLGDLQDKPYTFHQAHIGGGAGISYEISDHFAARLHLLFGKISADDKLGKNKSRNLNFTSGIFESHLALIFYPWALNSRSITPYAFGGIGVFHFNPYTKDTTNVKYFLQPMSTEGQGFVAGRDPYKLTQFSLPFGGGIKLSLTDDMNVGLELGLRKTFTDYLDDVSKTYVDPFVLIAERGPKAVELAYRGGELKDGNPVYPHGNQRGNPGSLDFYYYTAITFSFRLGAGNLMASGGRASKQYDCPVL